MLPSPDRRFVILAEGQFGGDSSKTARGVIRYASTPTVAVLDSTHAGKTVGDIIGSIASGGHVDIPIVASLDEALRLPDPPTTLILGIAPAGGKLPASWRATILEALNVGLDVASGLHIFLGDDPQFEAAAAASGARNLRLPAAAGTDGGGHGPRSPARQEGDPHRRHGLRRRQDGRLGRGSPGQRAKPDCRAPWCPRARPA